MGWIAGHALAISPSPAWLLDWHIFSCCQKSRLMQTAGMMLPSSAAKVLGIIHGANGPELCAPWFSQPFQCPQAFCHTFRQHFRCIVLCFYVFLKRVLAVTPAHYAQSWIPVLHPAPHVHFTGAALLVSKAFWKKSVGSVSVVIHSCFKLHWGPANQIMSGAPPWRSFKHALEIWSRRTRTNTRPP